MRLLLPFALFVLAAISAVAQNSIKTINNPSGGQIVYGPLDGQSTMQGAMAFMLHNVHGHFGDRPQVGRAFQAGTDSVASFFSLTAKLQGGKKMAGIVIVSLPQGSKPAAAVFYDDADRFPKTAPVLMRKLNEAWHKEAERTAGATHAAREVAPLPLTTATGGDQSASMGLPSGWKLTMVNGGALAAAGPNGEAVQLGLLFQNIYDTRNPKAQGLAQYMQMSHKQFFLCPYGGDLAAAYRCVIEQNRRFQNLPPASIRVINAQRVEPMRPYEAQAALLLAEVDLHEGAGPVMSSIRVASMQIGPSGNWAMAVSREALASRLIDAEWPTIKAMVATYRQNGRVIFAETQVVINQINATAEANRIRAAATSAAHDQHNRDVEAYWDDNAKYNKSFENYTLDRTIVEDNQLNGHLTTNYDFGDFLVRNDPDRFKYVPTRDFLKGVDY